jgi:hypothetical protein
MFLYLVSERVIRVHKWCIKRHHLPSARNATTENIVRPSVQSSFVLRCNGSGLSTETNKKKTGLCNFVQKSRDKLLTENVAQWTG